LRLSAIKSVAKIDGIEGSDVLMGKHRIPISRQDKDSVLETIFKDKLLKR
jgi:hypothetical protein